MPQQRIWLTYDLGVRGDFVGLYNWLDTHEADECGDSVATFVYSYDDRVEEHLIRDLRSAIEVTNRTRIYLVYRDESTDRMKGRFIIGHRRASAWAGYASNSDTVDDEAVS